MGALRDPRTPGISAASRVRLVSTRQHIAEDAIGYLGEPLRGQARPLRTGLR